MVDVESIEREYNKLKNLRHSTLLPLEKIIALENEKDNLIKTYLSKIKKINDDYSIISDHNFTVDDIIIFCRRKFGDLNFIDKSSQDGKIFINCAFHFCIISLRYQNDKFFYKVTVFWDL